MPATWQFSWTNQFLSGLETDARSPVTRVNLLTVGRYVKYKSKVLTLAGVNADVSVHSLRFAHPLFGHLPGMNRFLVGALTVLLACPATAFAQGRVSVQ